MANLLKAKLMGWPCRAAGWRRKAGKAVPTALAVGKGQQLITNPVEHSRFHKANSERTKPWRGFSQDATATRVRG